MKYEMQRDLQEQLACLSLTFETEDKKRKYTLA